MKVLYQHTAAHMHTSYKSVTRVHMSESTYIETTGCTQSMRVVRNIRITNIRITVQKDLHLGIVVEIHFKKNNSYTQSVTTN